MISRGMILRTCLVLVVCAGAGLIPAAVQAQADPDSVKLRNDCRLAAQVLDKGRPAPKYDWALSQIEKCDPGLRVEVVTALLHEHAHGTVTRDEIVAAFNTAYAFWDQDVLETLSEIAADPTALDHARIQALAELTVYLDPQAIPAAGFRAGIAEDGTPVESCFSRSFDGASSRPVQTEPMVGFRSGLVTELWRLSREPAPDAVKGAIICTALAGG